eukprot:893798_1
MSSPIWDEYKETDQIEAAYQRSLGPDMLSEAKVGAFTFDFNNWISTLRIRPVPIWRKCLASVAASHVTPGTGATDTNVNIPSSNSGATPSVPSVEQKAQQIAPKSGQKPLVVPLPIVPQKSSGLAPVSASHVTPGATATNVNEIPIPESNPGAVPVVPQIAQETESSVVQPPNREQKSSVVQPSIVQQESGDLTDQQKISNPASIQSSALSDVSDSKDQQQQQISNPTSIRSSGLSDAPASMWNESPRFIFAAFLLMIVFGVAFYCAKAN